MPDLHVWLNFDHIVGILKVNQLGRLSLPFLQVCKSVAIHTHTQELQTKALYLQMVNLLLVTDLVEGCRDLDGPPLLI